MKHENQFGELELKENLLQYVPKSGILKFSNKLTRKGGFTFGTDTIEIPYRDIKTVVISKKFVYHWILYALGAIAIIGGFMEQKRTFQSGLYTYSYKEVSNMDDKIAGLIIGILLITTAYFYSKKAISKAKALILVYDDGKRNKAYVFASQSEDELSNTKQAILDKVRAY